MKIKDQMELRLPQTSEGTLPASPERAEWWFMQMKKVVESEALFDPEPFVEVDAYATPRWIRSKTKPGPSRRW